MLFSGVVAGVVKHALVLNKTKVDIGKSLDIRQTCLLKPSICTGGGKFT